MAFPRYSYSLSNFFTFHTFFSIQRVTICTISRQPSITTEFFSFLLISRRKIYLAAGCLVHIYLLYMRSRCIMNPEFFLRYSHFTCARGNQAVGVDFIVNVEKRCVVRLKNPENEFAKVRWEDDKRRNGTFEGNLDGKLKNSEYVGWVIL